MVLLVREDFYMNVKIKQFDVDMKIKNKGIEIDVSNTSTHLGDLYVTGTNLTWCKGKTRQANGKKVTWEKFMAMMDSLN